MKRTTTLPMMLALTAVAGFAVAQPAKKEKQEEKNLLRGPDVKETTTTTTTNSDDARPQLSEEQRQKLKQRMFQERPIEMRELVMLTRARGGNNPLELSDTQREQIREIQQQYREEIRAFQQEHQEKIIALRAKVSEEAKARREEMRKRRSGEMSDAMQEQGEDAMEDEGGPREGAAARELREFINSSPPATKAMKSLRSVLTDEQYSMVEDHVFKTRMRAMQRRGNNNARPAQVRRGVDPEQVRTQRREREQDRERDMERGKQKKDDDSDG